MNKKQDFEFHGNGFNSTIGSVPARSEALFRSKYEHL
jgi:hypothetical protein